MKHTIEIDGEQRDIEIKAMDESFIVYRKMYMPPLTSKNIGTIAQMTMFHNWNASGERFGWRLLTSSSKGTMTLSRRLPSLKHS